MRSSTQRRAPFALCSYWPCAGALCALTILSSSPLWAQTACSPVIGVVVDATSALIPGAEVKVDGKVMHRSGPDGRFLFDCVAAGQHTFSVSSADFAPSTRRVTTPHAGDLIFHLVAASEASITVEADEDAAQVQAPGGTNGLIVSGKQLQALADDPDDLLREIQQLAAASGGSPSHTTLSVDGFQDDAKLPPKDSIAYINVSPDLFSAEFREPPFGGGRVEVYTKPGAKAFHGALFTTNSSSWMNARDPFTTDSGTIGKQRYGFDSVGADPQAWLELFVVAGTSQYR